MKIVAQRVGEERARTKGDTTPASCQETAALKNR